MQLIMRKTNSLTALEKPIGLQLSLLGFPRRTDNSQDPANLAKISHDIRGSINVINGYAQIMLDGVNGDINEEQREALQDMLKCGDKLYELLDIILQQLETASGNK